MIRRGSIVVPTAPYVVHHPWQVEWDKGVELKCYTGIIRDQKALVGGEWEPKRFPEKVGMSMAVTSQGMSQRSISQGRVKMQSKPYATGAKSGSAKIKFRESFGRATAANAIALDEQKGYAFWKEPNLIGSSKPDSIYLILHSEVDGAVMQWYLSWVNETDLLITDYKIAVIKKNVGRGLRDWTLLQLWKSDIEETPAGKRRFYEVVSEEAPSGTFKIKFMYDELVDWNQWVAGGLGGYQWGSDNGMAQYPRIFVPTVNGTQITPAITTTPSISITQTTHFYLEIVRDGLWTVGENGAQGTATDYPRSASIMSSTTPLGDLYSAPNCTFTVCRYPIALVTIEASKIKSIEMLTEVKANPHSKMTVYVFGGYIPTEWDYQGDPPVLVITNNGSIVNPTFAIGQRYSMGNNPYFEP